MALPKVKLLTLEIDDTTINFCVERMTVAQQEEFREHYKNSLEYWQLITKTATTQREAQIKLENISKYSRNEIKEAAKKEYEDAVKATQDLDDRIKRGEYDHLKEADKRFQEIVDAKLLSIENTPKEEWGNVVGIDDDVIEAVRREAINFYLGLRALKSTLLKQQPTI